MSKISQDASESQDFAFDEDLIEINVNNQAEDDDDLSEVQFIEQLKKGQKEANQQINSQNQMANNQQNQVQSQNYQQELLQNDGLDNQQHEGEIVSFREDILEQFDESQFHHNQSQKNDNLNNSLSYSNKNKSQTNFFNDENLQQGEEFSSLNIFQRNHLEQEIKKLSTKKDDQVVASQGSLEEQFKPNSQQINNFSSQNQFTSNFEQELELNNQYFQVQNKQNIFQCLDTSNNQQQSQISHIPEGIERFDIKQPTINIDDDEEPVKNDNDQESSNLLELPVFESEKHEVNVENQQNAQQNDQQITQNVETKVIQEDEEEEDDEDDDEMDLLKNIANTYSSQQRQKQSEELNQDEQLLLNQEKELPQQQQSDQLNQVNQQDQLEQKEVIEAQQGEQEKNIQNQQANDQIQPLEEFHEQQNQNMIDENKQTIEQEQQIIEQDNIQQNDQCLNQNQQMQQEQEQISENLNEKDQQINQEGHQMLNENQEQQNNEAENNKEISAQTNIESQQGLGQQENNNQQEKENESKKMEIEFEEGNQKVVNESQQNGQQEGKQLIEQQTEKTVEEKVSNSNQDQNQNTLNKNQEDDSNVPKKSISEAPQTIASIFQQLASVFSNMIIPQSMVNMSLSNNKAIEQQPEQFQTEANIQQQINQLQNQVTFIQNSVIHIPNHLQQVTNLLAKVTNSNITISPNIQQLTTIQSKAPIPQVAAKDLTQNQKPQKETKLSVSKEENEKAKKAAEKSKSKKQESSEDEESEEENESSEEGSGSESEEESEDELSDLKNISSKFSNANQKQKIGSGTLSSSKSNSSLLGFGSSLNKKTTYIQPKNNFSAPKTIITTPTKGLATSFGSSKVEPPQEPQIDQITINAATIGFKEPKLFIAESERVVKSDDLEIEDESLKSLYEYLNKLDQPSSFMIIKDQFPNLTDEQIHTTLHDFKSEEKIGIVELFLPKYAKCNSARIDYYFVEMIIPPPKPKIVEPEHTEEQKENTVEKTELKIENAGDRKKYDSMSDEQLLSYQKELNLRKQALLDKKQNANPTSDRLKKIQQWNEMKEVISTVFERIAVLKGKRIQEICDDFGVKLED